MNPVLYLDNRSPPCRSVLLLIEELGIEVEKQYIDLEKQENLQENYLKVFLHLIHGRTKLISLINNLNCLTLIHNFRSVQCIVFQH